MKSQETIQWSISLRIKNIRFQRGNGNGHSETSNWRFKRLEFSIFAVIAPDGWIVKAERWFDFYQLLE